MNQFGFIITRHVNSELTNKYWNNCVQCIRRFYPHKKIVIIDDKSNQDLVIPFYNYINVEIIKSEFPGRGELLPYYYFIRNHFFDNAVIIHDSVFFHRRINFEKLIGMNVLPMWHFDSDNEYADNSLHIVSSLNNSARIQNNLLLQNKVLGFDNLKWFGCFGSQSFINRKFLLYLERKYSLSKMIFPITCRKDRSCLERILGVIFCSEYPIATKKKSLLGNIFKYQNFGNYNYENYKDDIKRHLLPRPIIKVWTGR